MQEQALLTARRSPPRRGGGKSPARPSEPSGRCAATPIREPTDRDARAGWTPGSRCSRFYTSLIRGSTMATEARTHHKARWTQVCRMLGNSRMMAPFRSRAGRHRLVGLYLLVLAALPVVGWLAGQLWMVLLLLIPYVIGSLLLAVATQGMLDRPLRSLDERQLHLRRSVFRE